MLVFLVNNSSVLRLITKYDNILLQYYDTPVIAILDRYQGIYDDCYYNLRQVLQFTTLLQFTTEQGALVEIMIIAGFQCHAIQNR